VNLWAAALLEASESAKFTTKYGSKDIDLLRDEQGKIIDILKKMPGWDWKATDLKNFTDTRAGRAYGVAPDGRLLLVEVLTRVHGLEPADLKACSEIEYNGTRYRVLDPIAMLKAKAANVRDIKQDDEPPRHDREHLQLIARCFPLYLRTLEQSAREIPSSVKPVAATFSRAFASLQDPKTAATLRAEGIDPVKLMPAELAQSPVSKIATAYMFQMPRLTQQPGQRLAP